LSSPVRIFLAAAFTGRFRIRADSIDQSATMPGRRRRRPILAGLAARAAPGEIPGGILAHPCSPCADAEADMCRFESAGD
jgi:hypothetical protein